VSVDVLFETLGTPPEDYVMAHCYGDYTTNVAVADITGGKAWVAWEFEGAQLQPEHGGPARLVIPHLYFWKSAKWIRDFRFISKDAPGFWEAAGYHMRGDPWHEERYWGD
jgi:DMSO/TMAO reductase YedYZ molybdopterin-dependent catalytic subunit